LVIDWTSGRWLLAGLHFALCFMLLLTRLAVQ
jgi:hypothetical protein